MHFRYGVSLRNMFAHAPNLSRYDRLVGNELNNLSLQELTGLLRYAESFTSASHPLILAGPLPTDRTSPETSIASKYVLEKNMQDSPQKQGRNVEFYGALRDEPSTSSASGVIFEFRVHRLLRGGWVLNLFPICNKISGGGEIFICRNYTTTDHGPAI